MLGSSHSACFRKINFSPNFQLSIAANASGGLFRNLQINEKGEITCFDKNKEWNNTVFKKSLGESSRFIQDYDSIILNINYKCNLPLIFNVDNTNAQTIDTYSFELVKEVIQNSLTMDRLNLKQNQSLIAKLRSSRYEGQIHLALTPFTTSTHDSSMYEGSSLCSSRKQFLLDFISSKLRETLGIEILLPSISMIDDYLFIKKIYASSAESTWREQRPESIIINDLSHKNQKYAIDLIQANLDKINFHAK